MIGGGANIQFKNSKKTNKQKTNKQTKQMRLNNCFTTILCKKQVTKWFLALSNIPLGDPIFTKISENLHEIIKNWVREPRDPS